MGLEAWKRDLSFPAVAGGFTEDSELGKPAAAALAAMGADKWLVPTPGEKPRTLWERFKAAGSDGWRGKR